MASSTTTNDSSDCLTLDFGPYEDANLWQQMPDCDKFVGAPRSKHTVVTYRDALYVFGGDNGKEMLNDMLRFDIKEGSWSTVPCTGASPAPRYHHTAVVYYSSLYVFGGYQGDIHSNSNLKNVNDLWQYKFENFTWCPVVLKNDKSCLKPCPRSAHGSAVFQDKLYIFAGYDGNARLRDMWCITLDHDQDKEWKEVECFGESPPPICNFPVSVLNDFMYVFSGQMGAQITNSLFRFHFPSNTWTRICTESLIRDTLEPPLRRYGHSMCAFENSLLIFGGAADAILPNSLYRYDLDCENWEIVQVASGSVVPSGRLFHAATICESFMYVFGGTTNDNNRSGEIFRISLSAFPPDTLAEDFRRLVDDPKLAFSSDLTFLVGDNEVAVKSHFAIVAARCENLKNLIIIENNSEEDVVGHEKHYYYKLPKADVNAFRLVLEFLYTDQIRLDQSKAFTPELIQIITKVLQLSIECQLVKLEKLCIKYFKGSVNIGNVLETLKNATSVSLVPIKEYCLRFIIKEAHYNSIVMSKEFESLDQPLMVEIIRRRQQKDNSEAIPNVSLAEAATNLASDKAMAKHTLREDMKIFLNRQDYFDAKLILNGITFPAHKAILIARSSYFEGLFRSFSPDNIKVQIGDTTPSTTSFRSLLRYIYYGEVEMPPQDSLYLFSAYSFYMLTNSRLQAFCKHNLERKMQIDNIIQIFEAADRSNTRDMKDYTLNLIVRHIKQIAPLPQLEKLSNHLLLEIIRAVAERTSDNEDNDYEYGSLFPRLDSSADKHRENNE